MSTRLEDLSHCFQGVSPSVIATCGRDGEPNVTYLSQVYYAGSERVALSCQFFNKTKRNVVENPFATVVLHDPLTFETWRLRLRFDHEETSGPLFDTMATRIQVIASHTGMAGVFKLLSADVYDVLSLEPVDGFLWPADPTEAASSPKFSSGPLTEIRGLQVVSCGVARATDLEQLLGEALRALDELFGFSHSMVLLSDECAGRLVAIASRGYGTQGLGAEVALGAGLIGTVAQQKRMVRISGVGCELRYGRAIRGRIQECGDAARLAEEIPLPGLPDARAQLALPLLASGRLVGVLALESRDPLAFDEWDEAYMQILANQIAMGIDRMQTVDDGGDVEPAAQQPNGDSPAPASARTRNFTYYENDDCVFVDGEYLVRNVPAKILWKILKARRDHGQVEFTNRELRLDPSLGLPPIKDNLESRLILLRKRLVEKCPDVRIVAVRRGRFALELDCAIALTQKQTA